MDIARNEQTGTYIDTMLLPRNLEIKTHLLYYKIERSFRQHTTVRLR